MTIDPNLKPEHSKASKIILFLLIGLTVAVGLFILLVSISQRSQESWDTPMYRRDPRAPKICLCYWMRSAFRVPCEDVPPELLR
jgi:hypothetical protein